MDRRDFVIAGLALGFLAATAPASAQTAAGEPLGIVEQIYKISAGKNGKYEGNSAFFVKTYQKRWFSKSLLKGVEDVDKMSKRTGDMGIDFDPVTNSQDPTVKGLKIAVESATPTKSVVLAKFNTGGTTISNVRYIFVRESNAWKLDEITGDNGDGDGWSMREVIKALLKPRER